MSFNNGFHRRSVLGPVLAVLLFIWLVLGAVAADFRHYFEPSSRNCANLRTVAVTVLAGPLNFTGANPAVRC